MKFHNFQKSQIILNFYQNMGCKCGAPSNIQNPDTKEDLEACNDNSISNQNSAFQIQKPS